jgi:LynF/TruF/PatF family peptide O-prenyltransferase
MNPLILVYDFHKKGFGLEENTFLRLFEALLSTPWCSMLECSVKISPQITYAGRLRLGYEKEYIHEGLHAISWFLHEIARCKNVHLNHDMLDQIINKDLDVSRVIAVGVGLDYKRDMDDAKVKYYLLLREYPEKVDQVLSLHQPLDNAGDYLVHEEFGFGISLYFDGRTNVEIYPSFSRQHLNNAVLLDKLGLRDAARVFIEESNLLHISFGDDGTRQLHFSPQRPTRFVHLLNNRQLSLVYSHVQILNYILSRSCGVGPVSVGLCLIEDEIITKNIESISLHYALTSRAWENSKDTSLSH